MEKLRPYFALSGRTSRLGYWKTVLTIIVAILVSCIGSVVVRLVSYPLGTLALILVALLSTAALFCLAVRRLHDRGKSAWWLLLFSVLPGLLSGLGDLIPDTGPVFYALSLPFSIWAFVEMGCLRGTPGPNKYGEDPLERAVTEAFA